MLVEVGEVELKYLAVIFICILALTASAIVIKINQTPSNRADTVTSDSFRGVRVPNFQVILERKVTLREFLSDPKIYEMNICLPTWMPDGIRLVGVYNRPIILSFADREVPDFWHDNITIEISEAIYTPSPDELREICKKRPNVKVIEISNTYGLLCVNASTGPPVPYRYSTFIQLWIRKLHIYNINAFTLTTNYTGPDKGSRES